MEVKKLIVELIMCQKSIFELKIELEIGLWAHRGHSELKIEIKKLIVELIMYQKSIFELEVDLWAH